jgi:hypothetical protein
MIGIVAQRAEIKKEPGLSCPGSSLSQGGSMTLIFQRFFSGLSPLAALEASFCRSNTRTYTSADRAVPNLP